jgi:glycine dehydrogenase subunit 2
MQTKKKRLRRFHEASWDEPLIFELGEKGQRGTLLPEIEKEIRDELGGISSIFPQSLMRKNPPELPELGQPETLRHFLRLSQETIGAAMDIDIGRGTCTMKYNPPVHEEFASSHKITELHPYQDEETVQGILEVLYKTGEYLKELSGMDVFCLHPAGGTQAIYANAAVVRAYHESLGEGSSRNEIITTIFSHPGNAGAPSTAGFTLRTIYPDKDGYPDIESLKQMLSKHTAALLITNPEDTGIFNPRIKEFVDLVHEAGGLCVYDQANLNGVMGLTRASDAGFDLCQFNLHKTFAAPHGSQGPGCGAQGAVKKLEPFLPAPLLRYDGRRYYWDYSSSKSIGKIGKFYGTPPVALKAYAYIRSLGGEGLRDAALISILNNNYLQKKFQAIRGVSIPYENGKNRLEQIRYSFETMKKETGIGTDDLRRRCIDFGVQDFFTSHHPWVVPEPFTPEPCESFSKADIDEFTGVFEELSREAYETPELILNAPYNCAIKKIKPVNPDDYESLALTWRAWRKKENKKTPAEP